MPDIEMPQLGETVTEGTITKWFKQVGDHVAEDEVLFEVSTDKVDSEVPSPVEGTLTEILVPEGDTVDVGTRLAVLSDGESSTSAAPDDTAASDSDAETADADADAAAEPEDAEPEAAPEPEPDDEAGGEPGSDGSVDAPPATTAAPPPPPATTAPSPSPAPLTPTSAAPSSSAPTRPQVASPLVRKLANDHDLDLDGVTPTGAGGRITRADVQRSVETHATRPSPASKSASASPTEGAPTPAPIVRPVGAAEISVPLSNIRRRIGEHMTASKQLAPHAMTAVEVDYEGVERVRRAYGQQWRDEEGFSLTYLPFIARAVIDALHEFPAINATVGDGELVLHNYVNLAIAVDLDFEGLLAPVIHDADQKRLRAIAREVRDLATRARSKQLAADEVVGGTFTLTNAGSYGTHMVIPVINQPQVAILSTDGVQRRPVVVTDAAGDESIAIHSMGLLPLSWDHRAFDGAYSAAFLARVREIIETRDWAAEL